MNTNNYLSELRCARCQQVYDHNQTQTYCLSCNAPLFAKYELEEARRKLDRDEISSRLRGMWRWQEILPVNEKENQISLGEGDTPLVHLKNIGQLYNFPQLYAKDEGVNPTGTFKARGLAVAVSKALELGHKDLIIPTAGNAGGALAFYAARAGVHACVVMPEDVPRENLKECQLSGAELILVRGNIHDAAKVVREKCASENWFDVSTFKEPYRVEGKKIMGYELAEAFQWGLPDVIVYPTGGGTGLVGMWKAFKELSTLGWLEASKLPRMVTVQSSGCAPIVRAYKKGAFESKEWKKAKTIASGLRVPKSFADREILDVLYASNGTAVDVSDEEIVRAYKQLAQKEGILASPEGAATLAGLIKLQRDGWLSGEEQTVIFITGSGLKYFSVMGNL